MKSFAVSALISLATLLAGCTSLERPLISSLEPLSEDATYRYFKFKAVAGPAYSEETHPEMLAAWLADNGMTGHPYEITARQEIRRQTTLFGDVKDVFYTVRVRK